MVKVHIISGFLGAGKTSFIKKLICLLDGEKTAILENEFGEVAIDGDIIEKEGYDVIELPSGCICCSLKTNFYDALEKIVEDINPENIIIEPTGLGILSEILNILNMEPFKEKCRVESLITIVDGENYLEQEEIFGEFFKDQIANAKVLFVSKVDKISESTLNKIIKSLREINKSAYITDGNIEKINIDQLQRLLNTEEIEINYSFNHGAKADIEGFHSSGFKLDKYFLKEELENKLKALKSGNYGEIYRAKGILKGDKSNLEFNYVNGNYVVTTSNLEVSFRICIIGKDLNESRLKLLFDKKDTSSIKRGDGFIVK